VLAQSGSMKPLIYIDFGILCGKRGLYLVGRRIVTQ